MPTSIVADAGDATANSFVTEADAIAYLATRLNLSGWVTVSGSTCTEDEKKALIEATRELSALSWDGSRVDTTQSLSWPRADVVNQDDPDLLEYDIDVIPVWLESATIELAHEFLKAGTTDIASADRNAGVITKIIGPIETDWESSAARPSGLARFPRVMALIRRYLASGSGALQVVRS